MNKKKKILIGYGILTTVICLFLIFNHQLLTELVSELKTTSLTAILLLFLLSIGYNFIEGCNTTMLCRVHKPDFQVGKGIGYSYQSFFYTIIPVAGVAVSSLYYFNKNGISPDQGMGICVIKYVIHKISAFVYCLLLILMGPAFFSAYSVKYRNYLILAFFLTAIIIAGLILLCTLKQLHKFVVFLTGKLSKMPKLHDMVEKACGQIDGLQEQSLILLKSKKVLLRVFLCNALKLSMWYLMPVVILYQYPGTDSLSLAAMTALSIALAGVIPSPNGMGGPEVAFSMIFIPVIGVTKTMSSLLLYRFGTFVIPVIFGGVYVAYQTGDVHFPLNIFKNKKRGCRVDD